LIIPVFLCAGDAAHKTDTDRMKNPTNHIERLLTEGRKESKTNKPCIFATLAL
jgi:hypothetical protein